VSRGEADDFEFGRSIDSCEKLVHSKHDRVLEFGFTALAALENRESLQNHDGGVSDLEGEIGYPVFQQAATDTALHFRILLIRNSPSLAEFDYRSAVQAPR
jgi:hypothetical protein